VVLAAGAGERFGGAKQLAPLRGRPLLEHALATMAGVCDRVVVVLGAHAEEVRSGVDLQGAEAVLCDDWAEGTFASLRAGLHAIGHGHDAVVVALGDQPGLTSERIEAVLACEGPLVRARDGGAPSHPVVIRHGARVTPEALRTAPGPELGPLGDVDTREALATEEAGEPAAGDGA
jgi:CTP:molybdopterin cytidylyltransferase MocA